MKQKLASRPVPKIKTRKLNNFMRNISSADHERLRSSDIARDTSEVKTSVAIS